MYAQRTKHRSRRSRLYRERAESRFGGASDTAGGSGAW